jgi:hypothetical protein
MLTRPGRMVVNGTFSRRRVSWTRNAMVLGGS